MIYRFKANVEVEVEEEIELEIEADDYEEALDVAYDILDDPEHSEFVADRYRVMYRFYGPRKVKTLEDSVGEEIAADSDTD